MLTFIAILVDLIAALITLNHYLRTQILKFFLL